MFLCGLSVASKLCRLKVLPQTVQRKTCVGPAAPNGLPRLSEFAPGARLGVAATTGPRSRVGAENVLTSVKPYSAIMLTHKIKLLKSECNAVIDIGEESDLVDLSCFSFFWI